MPTMTRVYPERPLRFLLQSRRWWTNTLHLECDDVLPSAKKPYGRLAKENEPGEAPKARSETLSQTPT
jgi:hypothetical protein